MTSIRTLLTGWSVLAAGTLLSVAAQADILAESHLYEIDGMSFEGYVAHNNNLEQSRGTVLIVHDWDGLTDYEKRRAEMLAAQGYTAFAIDVYGQGNLPSSTQENQERAGELYNDRETFQRRLTGGLDEATNIDAATDNIVVIGYCFGGAGVLELARTGADSAGFVSFHGSLDLPEGQNYMDVTAPVMLQHGSADPVSGMEALAALIDRLREAEIEHSAQIHGGARHAFTVYDNDDYDLAADRASWQALNRFLAQHLN